MAATFTPLKNGIFISGDPINTPTLFERLRQSLLACAFRTCDLGGSSEVGIDGTGARDILESRRVTLPGSDLQGFIVQARVEVRTDSPAGTSVTPKIVDVTTGSPVDHVVGTTSTSLVFAEQTLVMTMPFATRKYRLMVTKSNADALVYAVGVIEILAP